MTTFDRVKKLADKQKISIVELEERLGFGKNSLYSWKRKIPNGASLEKVADFFNVSVDYLLGRSSEKTSASSPSFQTWFRNGNSDLTEEEQEELLDDVEDYLAYRKQRILKDREN